jgi:hypothetical protein
MKKEFTPYYVSRAILSVGFAILVMGLNWRAVIAAVVVFGFFLLYLHSGWFAVDLKNPLFPLRRDARGHEAQRKALIAAILVSLLIYLLPPLLSGYIGLSLIPGSVVLAMGALTYFIAQFILMART